MEYSPSPEDITNTLLKFTKSPKAEGKEYSDYTEALTDLCAHIPRGAFGHGWKITKEGIKKRTIENFIIENDDKELNEKYFYFELEMLEYLQAKFDFPDGLKLVQQQEKRMDKEFPGWRVILEPESVAHAASTAVHLDGTSIILMDPPTEPYLNSINAEGGRRLILIHWHQSLMVLRELRHFIRPWNTTVISDTYIDDFIVPDNNILQIQEFDLPLSTLNGLKTVHYPHIYLHSDIQEFFTPQIGPFFREKLRPPPPKYRNMFPSYKTKR